MIYNKSLIVLFFLFMIIFLLKKSKNIRGGSGLDNMPEGPEKEKALKNQKKLREDMIKDTPQFKKTVWDNYPVQQIIKKYVNKYGASFVTFVFLQRMYFPNYLEYPTHGLAWIPLDGDDNMILRAGIPGTPIVGTYAVPNIKEMEIMTDRMFGHPIPYPPLFLLDISITQLDIYAKMFEKYYITKKYDKDDSYMTKRTNDYIDNL